MRRLLALLGLVGAVSCSSPFEPVELAGIYTVRQIAGNALPLTYVIGERETTLIADSVFLRPDGTGRFGRTLEIEELGTQSTQRITMEFAYSIDGRTLTLHQPDCSTVCDLGLWSIDYHIWNGKLVIGDMIMEKRANAE